MEHLDAIINLIAIILASITSGVSVYLGIRIDLTKIHSKIENHNEKLVAIDKRVDHVTEKLHGHLENVNIHPFMMNRRETDGN